MHPDATDDAHRPLVIAHRTCPRDAPENTITGIDHARSVGADIVEVDVRRARDGVPMLLHDAWLLRTALRPYRLDWVSSEHAHGLWTWGGGRIPTFAEALDALGPTMWAAIDVKDPGAGEAVIAEVRNQGMEGRVLFWSKHEHNVRVCAAQMPEVEIALLRDTDGPDEMDRFLADTIEFGARAISAHWSQVGPELAARCEELGIALYAWCKTPDIDPTKLALLRGVVTDWPARARAAVATLP